jgi:hypothetical protein
MTPAMHRLVACAALWAMGAAAAWAQAPFLAPPQGPAAGAAEVRAALYGFDLAGEVAGTGELWTECIDPLGRTWWRIGDYADEGRLELRDDGQACFRYRRTGFAREACWAMREEEGRIRFDLVNGASLPLLVTSRRPVRACSPDGPMA